MDDKEYSVYLTKEEIHAALRGLMQAQVLHSAAQAPENKPAMHAAAAMQEMLREYAGDPDTWVRVGRKLSAALRAT